MAPTKIHEYVISERVRTGKVEELRRVTEEMRNFHIFEVGEFYHHGIVHPGNQETDEK